MLWVGLVGAARELKQVLKQFARLFATRLFASTEILACSAQRIRNNAVALHRASTKKPVDEARDPARQGTASGPRGLLHQRFFRFCLWRFRYFFCLLPRYRFGFRNGFFMPVAFGGGCLVSLRLVHFS